MTLIETGPADADAAVDDEIIRYLHPEAPHSFFLYAGAGSGKTRSLDQALRNFRKNHGAAFRRSGKRIAVITFTNAAADEITERVGQDPLFPISTIHSFSWNLINRHSTDIQRWLIETLPIDLAELHDKQRKGRASKAAEDRARAIDVIENRLEWLKQPRGFTYNANGDNFGKDSLSHAEVLKLAASFIEGKPSMQNIIAQRYPFLLIDESQDTNKSLMRAFFSLAEAQRGRFAIGLFGDVMQRIYLDGDADLATRIPDYWAKPVKRMNHRSPRRIVALGNAIRAGADGQRQLARNDSEEGFVRLFVVPATKPNRMAIEQDIHERMARLTADCEWRETNMVKTLTLEHHMAASRRGFLPMFEALRKNPKLSTGLVRGDLAGLRVFTECVVPLIAYREAGDEFNVMALLRRLSPLVSQQELKLAPDQKDPLGRAREAVEALMQLNLNTVSNLDVLQRVASTGIFEIPSSLQPFIERDLQKADALSEMSEDRLAGLGEEDDSSTSMLVAWREFLETPFAQMPAYAEYVSDKGPFGTHQGVKGLEFKRVLVILDDSEARGFLFSYETLFRVKPPSARRPSEGSETSADKTRRLLYVTCTRAAGSLALVAYTQDPDAMIRAATSEEWFYNDEIVRLE